MSRMLQKIPEDYQRFPLAPGFSTRHGCDMEKEITAQEASDLAFVSELIRLKAFDSQGIDPQPFADTSREARVALLDLASLRERKENPRHRPPGIDSPLLRDKIVQTLLFECAANPKEQMKRIVSKVGYHYGVSDRFVYKCLKKVTPERKKQMIESIIKCLFSGEMLLYLQVYGRDALVSAVYRRATILT